MYKALIWPHFLRLGIAILTSFVSLSRQAVTLCLPPYIEVYFWKSFGLFNHLLLRYGMLYLLPFSTWLLSKDCVIVMSQYIAHIWVYAHVAWRVPCVVLCTWNGAVTSQVVVTYLLSPSWISSFRELTCGICNTSLCQYSSSQQVWRPLPAEPALQSQTMADRILSAALYEPK